MSFHHHPADPVAVIVCINGGDGGGDEDTFTLNAAMNTLTTEMRKTPKTTQLFRRIACSSFSWRRSKRPLNMRNIPTITYTKVERVLIAMYKEQ